MIDAADTGESTWGHLADTEHFGRVSRNYVVVPKADLNLPKYRGSTRAGHCMIYSRSEERIFGIYSARAMVLVSVQHLCIVCNIFIKTISHTSLAARSKVCNSTNPAISFSGG
jgi:hypothetical protein